MAGSCDIFKHRLNVIYKTFLTSNSPEAALDRAKAVLIANINNTVRAAETNKPLQAEWALPVLTGINDYVLALAAPEETTTTVTPEQTVQKEVVDTRKPEDIIGPKYINDLGDFLMNLYLKLGREARANSNLVGIPAKDKAKYTKSVNSLISQYNELKAYVGKGLTKFSNVFKFNKELPFTKIPDLFNNLDHPDIVKYKEYLSKIAPEINNLKQLIRANIDGNAIKVIQENPLIHFMKPNADGKLVLSDDVVTVVAIAAYEYAATQLNGLVINTDSSINAMLVRDSKANISVLADSLFRYSGKNINNVADTIGNPLLGVLGISATNPIESSRLAHSLGFLGIKALQDMGYLEQKVISKVDYERAFKEGRPRANRANRDDAQNTIDEVDIIDESDFTDDSSIYSELSTTSADRVVFVRAVTQTTKGKYSTIKVIPKVEALIAQYKERDANKVSINTVLKEVFGMGSKYGLPITDPKETRVPKYLTNTKQKLSKIAKKTIRKANSNPYRINVNVFETFKALYVNDDTKDALLESLGYTFDVENTLQQHFRVKANATNNLLIREIEASLEFYENLGDKEEFYFNFEIWKNSRVGISNDAGIEPLGSKLFRHLIGLSAFRVDIPTNDLNSDLVVEFKKSVMAGFGVESDTKTNKEVVAAFDTLIQDKRIQDAIDSIESGENLSSISDILKDYKNKSHTLESLMNMKEYQDAIKGNRAIRSTTAREQDGKTNGPTIGTLMTLMDSDGTLDDILAAMGIFVKPGDTDYTTVSKNIRDTYQSIATEWNTALQNMNYLKPHLQSRAISLYNVQNKYFGDFFKEGKISKAIRELAKYPFMKTIYGQSIPSLRRDLGNTLLTNIYKRVQDANEDSSVIREVNEDIRALTDVVGNFPLEGTALNHRLSEDLEQAIIESVNLTYGGAMVSVINRKFRGFLAYRKAINDAMKLTADMFLAVLKHKVEEQEKVLGRTLSENEIYKIMYDKEGGLYEMLPTYATPNTSELDEGFFGLSPVKRRSDKSKVQVSYNKPIKNTQLLIRGARADDRFNRTTRSHTGGIHQLWFTDPGVGGLIGLIHSFDGSLAQRMIEHFITFGVHDAFFFPPTYAMEGGKYLNREFMNMTLDYSIGSSVLNTFNRVTDEFSKYTKLLDPKVVNNIRSKYREQKDDILSNIFDAEGNRREFAKKAAIYHQFASEGTAVANKHVKPTVTKPPVKPTTTEVVATDAEITAALEEGVDQEVNALLVKYKEQSATVTKVTKSGRLTIDVGGKKVSNIKFESLNLSEQDKQKIKDILNCMGGK
jgi:hypothetical protein